MVAYGIIPCFSSLRIFISVQEDIYKQFLNPFDIARCFIEHSYTLYISALIYRNRYLGSKRSSPLMKRNFLASCFSTIASSMLRTLMKRVCTVFE